LDGAASAAPFVFLGLLFLDLPFLEYREKKKRRADLRVACG
jgi:hypothetical protein